MSQPIQPPYQPQQPRPPMPAPQPLPQYVPAKRKRFGWLALILTAVISLGVGGAVGGASGNGTTSALPAPTVTTTVTEPPVDGGNAPTDTPTEAPTTKAPASYSPKPKDFRVTIKILKKECFGSAGCNISYKVGLDYLSAQNLPGKGTTDITYKVSGAEGPIIGTITIDSEGKFSSNEEITSTTSSSKKLVANVTEVNYNEFG